MPVEEKTDQREADEKVVEIELERLSMTVLKCKKKAFEFCKFFDAS